MRLVDGHYLLVLQFDPIDRPKEGMSFDVCSIIGTVADTKTGIALQETTKKMFGIRREFVTEAKRFVKNLSIHFASVFIVKGRKTFKHLIQKGTESPPINLLAIATGKKDFGGEIFGRSAKCEGDIIVGHSLFDETKVCEMNVAEDVEDKVFGFEIAINDSILMQIFDSKQDLSGIETSLFFIELIDV